MGLSLKPSSPLKKWVFILSAALLSGWAVLVLIAWLISQLSFANFILRITPKTFSSGTNILVLGLDATKGVQRSDSIIVAHISRSENRIGVMVIPRDTRVNVPGVGMCKINHAYAKGKGGLAQDVVSALLGIPIHHVIVLRLAGVAHIVDRLGGLTLTIDKHLHYVDKAGNLNIDLPPGLQTLNGETALGYLRYRHDALGDIGRISRQKVFLNAALNRVMETGQWLKVPIWIYDLSRYIETDLSIQEMLSLAFQVKSILSQGRLDTETLPGTPLYVGKSSYWEANPTASRESVDSLFHTQQGSSLLQPEPFPSGEVLTGDDLPDTDGFLEGKPSFPTVGGHPFRLEILNGNGQQGLAHKVAKSLSKGGPSIAHTGGTGTNIYPQTMIVDWKGNIDAVLYLARLLHIDPSHIIVYDQPDKTLDATLILGQDWPQLQAQFDQDSAHRL